MSEYQANGNGKTAVMLIHGIGDQMPMQTLRAFVKSVWEEDNNVKAAPKEGEHRDRTWWSKPDTLSENFDLRRITTTHCKNSERRVDFFEFYWAHMMHGAKYSHLIAGVRKLLFRKFWKLRGAQAQLYAALALAISVIAGIAYAAWKVKNAPSDSQGWVVFSLSILLPVFLGIVGAKVLSVLGDVPRYLHKSPENLHRRHEIQRAGSDLLSKLHERGYERIIVVGHSLGTVVGYDVLTDAWAKQNRSIDKLKLQKDAARRALEAEAVEMGKFEIGISKNDSKSSPDEKSFQDLQKAYYEELRRNGNSWRVTDFITLGSPLTHAEVLMAGNSKDLKGKFEDREYPKCPPFLETGIDGEKRFTYESKDVPKRIIPHHAALFGPTRWTNIYFSMWFVTFGDLVGGPLRNHFGLGVKDVPVWTWKRFGLFTHTCYWDNSRSKNARHVQILREALSLNEII